MPSSTSCLISSKERKPIFDDSYSCTFASGIITVTFVPFLLERLLTSYLSLIISITGKHNSPGHSQSRSMPSKPRSLAYDTAELTKAARPSEVDANSGKMRSEPVPCKHKETGTRKAGKKGRMVTESRKHKS